ncbi:MAG: type II toxin-antitoxin system PemK/MazF family toxin [bacterium]
MKDFQKWHIQKNELHKSNKCIYFRIREIWWCSVGLNIGCEQDGKNDQFERPILVLKKFNNDMLWVLPLTTVIKTGQYYYSFEYNNNAYSVILSQLRVISSKRLLRRIRKIGQRDFEEIRTLLKKMI